MRIDDCPNCAGTHYNADDCPFGPDDRHPMAPKTFRTSKGFTFVLGCNMSGDAESPRLISWNDPTTGLWQCEIINQAGCVMLQCDLAADTEITETDDGCVHFGDMVRLDPVGPPYIWGVTYNWGVSYDAPQSQAG